MATTLYQKERIRRAAALLWARQGYHATGIKELADDVGLGRATLYHHIGSKEQLLFEISTACAHQLVADAEATVAETDVPAAERLRRMSRILMRSIADNLPEWTVFFHEAKTLSGRFGDEAATHRERYEALWAELLEQGVRAGEFREPRPILLKGVLGMHNSSYLWLRRDGHLTPEHIADEFVDMILRGLLSDDGPRRRRAQSDDATAAL